MTESIRARAERLAGVSQKEFEALPLGDGIGRIELIDFCGGDAEMVARARKTHASLQRATPERDRKLNAQLVAGRPMHGSATRNTVLTFDLVMPLTTLRQLTRHLVGHDTDGTDVWRTGCDSFEVGGAFDEMSLRYVRMTEAVFYIPGTERVSDPTARSLIHAVLLRSQEDYKALLAVLPPELARDYIPGCVYSAAEWTVSWQGLADLYTKRRAGSGAQWELTQYVEAAWALCKRFAAPLACEHYELSLSKG